MNDTLTPGQRALFLGAADAALRVRRNALRMAAHMTGHRQPPHSESCGECREKWPCVTVLRAAGPLLDAVADLPSRQEATWLSRRKRAIERERARGGYDNEFWRGYTAALDDALQLGDAPNSDPSHLPPASEGAGR